MARYRGDLENERDYRREERYGREALGSEDEPYASRYRSEGDLRSNADRGRFGERADYGYGEPRYNIDRERFREYGGRRSSLYDLRGDLAPRPSELKSRLRCRDIMTRDLAVATRDTTLRESAIMMKQEDAGVIPVVDYDGNGNGAARTDSRNNETRHHSRGKLVGLVTDRDIAIRAVSEGKDCTTTRAEEIMSTDLHTARPNDRVVDVIRKMGDKQVRRIPVTNEAGYLVGMISMADIAVETHEDTELAEAIEEISKGSSFWTRWFG